jgi:hypothetical protein
MSDIAPIIETLEHRWMRAWVGRDRKALKGLTSSGFRLVIGSKPSVLLDAKSFLAAAEERFSCSAYRFGDVYARRHGSVAVFATQLELTAVLDGLPWPARSWVTDVWRKGTVRGWRLVERQLSAVEGSTELPGAVKALQLWR